MKNTLLLLLTLVLNFNCFSQEFDITKSEIFKDKKKNSELVFSIDDGTNGFITIRKYSGGMLNIVKGYYIEYFDKNLKLIDSFDYKVKSNRIKNVFIKNKKIHIIEGQISSFKKAIEYNVLISDVKKLKFTKTPILNISKTNFDQYFENISFKSFFYFVNLPDSNTIEEQVILSDKNKYFTVNIPVYNREKKTTKVFIYNDNLDLQYHTNITQDTEESFFDYLSFEISDKDGTLYLLGKSFENQSRKIKKKGKPNFHFELKTVNKTEQKNINFKEDEKFIKSLTLIKRDNRISCIGFYGRKKHLIYDGIVFFKINPESLKIENAKYNPFTKQFLFDKYGDNNTKTNSEKGAPNIELRDIEVLENDDLIITAEQHFITATSTPMGFGGVGGNNTYTDHYNDILLSKIDSNGNMLWARNINKSQTNPLTSSFSTLTGAGTTNLFINCSDKIKKISGNRIEFKQASKKKTNLYCIEITNNGAIDFEKLINHEDSKFNYRVNKSIISTNNSIVFSGQKGNERQIIKITVNK